MHAFSLIFYCPASAANRSEAHRMWVMQPLPHDAASLGCVPSLPGLFNPVLEFVFQ
ncbi:hypothetical protein HDC33_003082 [Sporosarcina sp. JAI121]|nr:hypothetical protein [Sporosarcina sp. JAI121]